MNEQDKRAGRIARRKDALAAAALADLGERGTIDAGTRVMARGGTRERRTVVAPQGVWYARCALGTHVEETWALAASMDNEREDSGSLRPTLARVDVTYHYAPTWARMPADTLRSPHRVRVRLSRAMGVALPQELRDPDAPIVRVAEDGTPIYRAARGAIAGALTTRTLWASASHDVYGVRDAARRYRRRAVIAHALTSGAGL